MAALGEHARQLCLYVLCRPPNGLFEIEGNSGHHGYLGEGSDSSFLFFYLQDIGELTVRLVVKKSKFIKSVEASKGCGSNRLDLQQFKSMEAIFRY